MKFSGKDGNGPMNKWLNFGGDPDYRLDTGIFLWICHCWEIGKVVSPNGGTVKTCLGGGMHCPSASSLRI